MRFLSYLCLLSNLYSNLHHSFIHSNQSQTDLSSSISHSILPRFFSWLAGNLFRLSSSTTSYKEASWGYESVNRTETDIINHDKAKLAFLGSWKNYNLLDGLVFWPRFASFAARAVSSICLLSHLHQHSTTHLNLTTNSAPHHFRPRKTYPQV